MAKTLAKRKSSFARQQNPQKNKVLFEGFADSDTIPVNLPPGKGLARNQAEAANYIAEMLVVLCNMAKDVDLKFLNYLLEMAYEESLGHTSKTREIVKNHNP